MRNDSEGLGHYHAPRGTRLHEGMDFLCRLGQEIVAPISGRITRRSYPYSDLSYSGCVIVGDDITVKMWYFMPDKDLIGEKVKQGDFIGVAQDISVRYSSKMKPHIHLQIEEINPAILLNNSGGTK